ncbi:MAG TPA: type III polyketide synthase [Rhizomicrobium sp.]|nr:type III polyketide synthase [Rhizomicrobium sp.]
MPRAFINRIATAAPPHDVHETFLRFGQLMLRDDKRKLALFDRMAERSGIAHRYSFLEPDPNGAVVDTEGFYRRGAFPDTAARMKKFEACAPGLAAQAAEKLLAGEDRSRITHVIVTSCTGLSAPGIDLELIERCGLPSTAERTMVGFMGCYAAVNALKLARHIVRSEPSARVLAVNLELCSLHLHETDDLEEILSFLLFADGCAAALVSADPVGVEMKSFRAALVPDTKALIRWNIRQQGFDMVLSGAVPGAIRGALTNARDDILGGANDIELWAVHPGGRTVLDAVEQAFGLPPTALQASRGVLHDYGNMSSGTVMFVLDRIMREAAQNAGRNGCAMSFGPGLVAETMMFRMAA